MITNYRKRKEVREMFLRNPNLNIYDLAKMASISPTQVSVYLDNTELYITTSLNKSNTYFLFTNILEKEVITDDFKNVQNGYCFTQKEKDFLRSYGLTFNTN